LSKLKLITLEKLIEMRENQEDFHLVEVLGADDFQEGHIPGAINIPSPKGMSAEEMDKATDAKDIKKDDRIVVYCASYTCKASTRAARLLMEAGYTNVLDFKGSKRSWKKAGFKLEQ
jgi:rhodanese-related sulfurtransferase